MSRSTTVWLAIVVMFCDTNSLCAGDKEMPVKFEAIPAIGSTSGIDKPTQQTVSTVTAWEAFWKQHTRFERTKPPVPKVDFDKEIVIVVARGSLPSGGYSLKLTRIIRTKNGVEVHYEEGNPAPGGTYTSSIVSPIEIVRLAKPAGKIIFVKDK